MPTVKNRTPTKPNPNKTKICKLYKTLGLEETIRIPHMKEIPKTWIKHNSSPKHMQKVKHVTPTKPTLTRPKYTNLYKSLGLDETIGIPHI